jgi:nicotinic acid mononucleotide adenylyltransferase
MTVNWCKIKAIHLTDAFGIIIEAGCGSPVANGLMSVEGSSNTVYFSECPYSRDIQDEKYGKIEARAVSRENVSRFISQTVVEHVSKNEKINFIYASSFQLGEIKNSVSGSTHGWIGVWTKNLGTRYFHVSVHDSMTRVGYMDRIAGIGTDILYHCLVDSPVPLNPENRKGLVAKAAIPSNCCIDMALNMDRNQVDLSEVFLTLRNETEDNFICVRDGKLVRMEDLFRDQETILLYKGSFNPVHAAHVHNAEVAKAKYGVAPVFVISSSVYQKGWIEPADIKQRVETLNMLGYSVIVTKDGYFNENTKYIRKKFPQPIVYVVGSDTMNRILSSSYEILTSCYTGIVFDGEDKVSRDLSPYSESLRSDQIKAFRTDFVNVKFFVINRPGSELHADAKHIADYYTLVEEHPEYFHISSTKIRELLASDDTESIKKLIPEKIFEKYIKTKSL